MNEHVIAWLFATILLILLAASGTTHWLIARRGATPTLINLRARVHAWWLMSAVLAAAFAVGRGGTIFLFWLVSFFALREFLSLVYSRRSDYRVMVLCYYFILPLQYFLIYQGSSVLFATFIPVYAFLFMPIAASLSGDSRYFLARAATAQWAVMIAVYCISHIPALLNLHIPGYPHNILLPLFLVAVVQAGDVLQYIWGKLFGRKKIMPTLSPSKTVIGTVGGVCSAALLGGALSAIGAEGKSLTFSLFGQTPLYHRTNRSLTMRYGYNYRDLNDDITAFGLEGKKHTHSVYLGVAGTQRMYRATLDYNANLTVGRLNYDSEYSSILGALSQTDEGTYAKFEADLTAVQQLGSTTDFLVKVSGQKASRNLDSSEEFYLGGPNGVRAYAQGEGAGDEGLLGTAELRWHAPVCGLTLSTFYDVGTARLSRSRIADDNSVTLRGWGVAAAYSNPGDWFARLDYARRIGLDSSVAAKNSARGRLWFLMGKIW